MIDRLIDRLIERFLGIPVPQYIWTPFYVSCSTTKPKENIKDYLESCHFKIML